MSPVITNLLLKSLAETLYMLSISAFIAAAAGIPLGILLVVTEKNGILSCPIINKPLAFIVNVIRSIPFIILMVAIIPLTRLIAGTSIGTTAAIVPLTLAAIPYTARMVETSIREIPSGLIEAAESMGASPFQIIRKVLIPEALPSVIQNDSPCMYFYRAQRFLGFQPPSPCADEPFEERRESGHNSFEIEIFTKRHKQICSFYKEKRH